MNDEEKRRWKKTVGRIGEDIVCLYFQQLGWRILSRNYRCGRSSEIDVIAISPEGITVFAEVKTRTVSSCNSSTWFESASDTISPKKRKRISTLASQFTHFELKSHSKDQSELSYRFDVVFVGLSRSLAFKIAQSDRFVQPVLDRLISNCVAGESSDQLTVIHCPSAFATKF